MHSKYVLAGLALLFSFSLMRGQDYVQVNAGFGAGSYNSLAIGSSFEYLVKNDRNWIKTLSYQHFRHFAMSAQDLRPAAETHHQAIFASFGYEARVFKWTSLVFSLGAGVTHVYFYDENLVGPSVLGQMQWLVHLGERTSLMLPLLILPKSAHVSFVRFQTERIFHKIELAPVGLRIKL